MTQLTLDGLHQTQIVSYEMTRDTVKKLEFTHDFTATDIDEAYVTLRDSSDVDVLTLTLEYHPTRWNLATDNEGEITFDDDDTAGLNANVDYKVGVMLVDVDGNNQVPIVGTIRFIDQIVYDDATAGYETWQTRAERDALLDALLETACASAVSVTAASGAGSITLEDASVLSAGDNFTLFDATNSEKHGVDSITNNVVTLSAAGDGATLVNGFTKDISVAIKDF